MKGTGCRVSLPIRVATQAYLKVLEPFHAHKGWTQVFLKSFVKTESIRLGSGAGHPSGGWCRGAFRSLGGPAGASGASGACGSGGVQGVRSGGSGDEVPGHAGCPKTHQDTDFL